MTKKVKLLLVSVLTIIAAFAFMSMTLVGLNSNTAYAQTAEQGINAVYIRIPEADQDETYYGIRFRGYVTSALYNANAGKDVVYGIEIKPADLADDMAADTNGEGQTLTLTQSGDVYYFYGSLVGLQEQNLTRPFVARSYYKIGEQAKVYSAWSEEKVVFSVATQAIADNSKDYAQDQGLQSIVSKVTNSATIGAYSTANVEITAVKELNSLVEGDVITVNATVTNGTKTLTVYPKISAVDGSGNPLEGYLTQVAGTQNQYKVSFLYGNGFKIKYEIGAISEVYATEIVAAETVKISNATELTNFLSTATTENAILTADITDAISLAQGHAGTNIYTGTFDGNGHTISNLTINGSQSGMFYQLGDAYIKNLNVVAHVRGDQSAVLAGRVNGSGATGNLNPYIENVVIDVKFTYQGTFQGGMFGQLQNGSPTIVDSLVYAIGADASQGMGALSGRHTAGETPTISNSYFVGVNPISDFAKDNDGKDTTNAAALSTTDIGNTYYATGSDLVLDTASVEGVPSKLYIGIKAVDFEYDSAANTITVASAVASNVISSGENNFVIITDSAAFYGTVSIADYVIKTAAELKSFAESATTGLAVLADDINMSGVTISSNTQFAGTLDGNGHKITNLTSNIFNFLGQSTIKNLAIIGAKISGDQIGIFAKQVRNAVTVENVFVSVELAVVNGGTFKGGLFGQVYGGAATIENSLVYVTSEIAPASQGIMIGAIRNNGSATITNGYAVSATGNAVSDWTGSYKVDPSSVNASLTPYATAKTFDAAVTAGSVALSDFVLAQWNAVKPLEAVELGTSYYQAASATDLVVDIASVSGDITKVTLAGEEIALNTADNKLTVSADALTALAVGDYELGIYTASTIYKQAIIVKDYVIANESQFVNFINNATSGEAVLVEDITITASTLNGATTFCGTFDGLGHKIIGLVNDKDGRGILSYLGDGATIKNVAFIDAVKKQNGGFLTHRINGTVNIENVMISIEMDATQVTTFQGAIVGDLQGTLNVTNCVVYVKNSLDSTKQGIIIGRHYSGSATITDSYFVGNASLVSGHTANDNATATNAKATPYATVDAFTTAVVDTGLLTEWQAAIWNAMKPAEEASAFSAYGYSATVPGSDI